MNTTESTLTLITGETLTGPTIMQAIRQRYGRLATFSIDFGYPGAIVLPVDGGTHLVARIRSYKVSDSEIFQCWKHFELRAAEQVTPELLAHVEDMETRFKSTGELPEGARAFFYLA